MIPRVNVLGVEVSAVDIPRACDELARWRTDGERSYVCVTGAHGVCESLDDAELQAIHNRAGLVVPDGMPNVYLLRWRGQRDVDRCYGPDLMLEMMRRSVDAGWRHFFYGGGDGVAERLRDRLVERFPGLAVVGTYCPPFRPLSDEEAAELAARIDASGADFVWVGLSTPKQERWMAAFRPRLAAAGLLGVGAAFDFHAGLKRQAPAWMQRAALEWLFRLISEPRRLWRRYLHIVPRFLALNLLQALGLRRFEPRR